MFDLKIKSAVIGLSTVAIMASLSISCAPPASNDSKQNPPPAAVSGLDTKAAACEAKIRSQMEDKSLQFTVVEGEFKAYAESANGSLSKLVKQEYRLSRVAEKNISLQIGHLSEKTKSQTNVEYDLSVNGKDSAGRMNISLKFIQANGSRQLQLVQKFGISESCGLTLRETNLEQISAVEGAFEFESLTKYIDGGRDHKKMKFKAANGMRLANVQPGGADVAALRTGDSYYVPAIGLTELVVQPTETQIAKAFGREFSLKSKKIDLMSDGKPFVTASYGEDKEAGVAKFTIAGQDSWLVPQAIWKAQALGASADLNQFVDVKLPTDYLKTKNSFRVIADQLPSYKNLEGYFEIVSSGTSAQTNQKEFIFKERQTPTYRDNATAEDLATNKTLRVDHPDIQKVANEILKREPKNRRKQIELILEYLARNYEYDYEMLKNNVVRPLTVDEALSRRKGVCQHYAVIFTTLSRALKIPSRIIMGFLLAENGPGGHAWVEAEVEPGLWQVIEPQLKSGLTDTRTRSYLPTSRSRMLEDKEASAAEDTKAMLELKIQILPL